MLDKKYTREKRERNERRGERTEGKDRMGKGTGEKDRTGEGREGKEKGFIKNFVLGAGEVAL